MGWWDADGAQFHGMGPWTICRFCDAVALTLGEVLEHEPGCRALTDQDYD